MATSNQIWDRYRVWLLKEANIRDPNRQFINLTKLLHNKSFYSLIPRDENREEDGIVKRTYFINEYRGQFGDGQLEYFLNEKPCSVLEMMIGLAIRMNNEWLGDSVNPITDELFVEMLRNLRILDEADPYEINWRLDVWLNREFDYDGNGSLFPLKINRLNEDQRDLEIWLQLMRYINEYYSITPR